MEKITSENSSSVKGIMSISAIVSNFNGLRYLPRLIESLRSQVGVDLEIIIVDRQSTDGSVEYLAGQPNIVVISEPPETGLVAGYHAGSKIASRENFFFCNEDMWFESDCLLRLIQHLNPKEGIIAADPWQWSYDGEHRIHAGTRFEASRFNLNSPNVFYKTDFDCDLPSGAVVPFPCAGAFLVVAKAYREIGGWDTFFFLNHEDLDLFLRAWQKGYKCVQVPEAKVYHACGASNQKVIQQGSLSVGKRRYISSFASIAIINFKYFTGIAIGLSFIGFLARVFLNLMRGRWSYLQWDKLVLMEIFGRLPHALAYRRENQFLNRKKPGQGFFREKSFLKNNS